MDFLNTVGSWSWGAVWQPVLAWTVLCLATQMALRFVPATFLRLHRDIRFALLLALPLGLALGTLVPEFERQAIPVAPARLAESAAPNAATHIASLPGAETISAWTPIAGVGVFTLAAALAALGALLFLLGSAWKLKRLLAKATPYEGQVPPLATGVTILVSDHLVVPISTGLIRRVIVLPRKNPEGYHLAVLHELTHHQQGDIGRVLISRSIGATFVSHPLVHRLLARLDLLMEMICDQIVLSRSGSDPVEYANLLLAYLPTTKSSGPRMALSMGRSHEELSRRIAVMNSTPRGSSKFSTAAAALLLIIVSGAVGCTQEDRPSESDALYEISGRVTDAETGGPLVGAEVLLEGTQLGSVTDNAGVYVVGSIPVGSYELRITHRGSEVRREDITVPTYPFFFDPEKRDPQAQRALSVHLSAAGDLVVGGEEVTLGELTELIERRGHRVLDLGIDPRAPVGRYLEALQALRNIEGIRVLTWEGKGPAPLRHVEGDIFNVVEQMPKLVGGLEALQRTIRYPTIAKRAGIQGRVIVQFIVTEDGQVVEPKVVRGIGAGADEEAVRAVQAARFLPGRQRGRKVKVRMSIPVTFRLKAPSPGPESIERGEPVDVDVFANAADVGREFDVVFTGPINWGEGAFEISHPLLTQCDAIITGTRTQPPEMDSDDPDLPALALGEAVGIKYR